MLDHVHVSKVVNPNFVPIYTTGIAWSPKQGLCGSKVKAAFLISGFSITDSPRAPAAVLSKARRLL